jgi:predicted phosphodiesterase
MTRVGRLALAAGVGLAGAWVAMNALGRTTVPMGPFRVELSAGLGRGVTDIVLAPLGRLTADTHRAPIHLTISLREVRVEQFTAAVTRGGFDLVVRQVERDARTRVVPFALRALGAAALGSLVAGALVYRRSWRQVVASVVAALVVVGGSEVATWRTYRPAALLTPTFSGSLALAPRLIGPASTALDRLDQFRAELSRIVEGAARVYTSIQTGPALGDEIRVLHVSDIHLSPLGIDFARQVAESFDVDLVLDTGDLTSFGTPVEDVILSGIASIPRPYVFVRGNHDSMELQAQMRRLPNATVLDGGTARVAGLTIYGEGDPIFTPDKLAALGDAEIARSLETAGLSVLARVQALPRPPDVVAVHDDRMAEALAGYVPLVVSGHFHQASTRVEDGTLFLRVGSSGGAGANVFTREGGVPLSAEVLYFARAEPHTLVAYDLIEQSPETGSLTVKRHVIEEEFGRLIPSPPPPSPTPPSGPVPATPSTR